MQEEYKTVDEFEDYEVSNYGNVRKVSTGDTLRQSIYKGYARVDLFKNWQNMLNKVALLAGADFISEYAVDYIQGRKLSFFTN